MSLEIYILRVSNIHQQYTSFSASQLLVDGKMLRCKWEKPHNHVKSEWGFSLTT